MFAFVGVYYLHKWPLLFWNVLAPHLSPAKACVPCLVGKGGGRDRVLLAFSATGKARGAEKESSARTDGSTSGDLCLCCQQSWPHPAVTRSEAWEIIHLRSVRILSSVCPPLAEETEPHPPGANGWGVEGRGRDDGGVGGDGFVSQMSETRGMSPRCSGTARKTDWYGDVAADSGRVSSGLKQGGVFPDLWDSRGNF